MQAATLTQELLQPTLRGVILLVLDQVRGEPFDALGEERDLHPRAPGVARRLLELSHVRHRRARALIRSDDLQRAALVRLRPSRSERARGVSLGSCARESISGQIRGF